MFTSPATVLFGMAASVSTGARWRLTGVVLLGLVLAAGDFNRDGHTDLAIGAPSEGIGAASWAGMVHVLLGSPSGLTAVFPDDQVWTQDSPGVDDVAESADGFGKGLGNGDFNRDGFADLAIGVPAEDIGLVRAGAVNVIYGSLSGLSVTSLPDQFLSQSVAPIADGPQSGDQFGGVLAAGDFSGDLFDDLAVGVPDEGVGQVGDAGAVNVFYGSANGLVTGIAPPFPFPQFWHQDSTGIEGHAGDGDYFGSALTVGDFNDDGCDDLAIGVDESIGSLSAAGAVNVLYGSYPSGLSEFAVPDQLWHQSSPGMPTVAEAFDWFGFSLIAGDFNGDRYADLAVGALGEDVNNALDAGGVAIIHGAPGGLNTTFVPVQTWSQQYVLPPQP
jgi:hypothetical protein